MYQVYIDLSEPHKMWVSSLKYLQKQSVLPYAKILLRKLHWRICNAKLQNFIAYYSTNQSTCIALIGQYEFFWTVREASTSPVGSKWSWIEAPEMLGDINKTQHFSPQGRGSKKILPIVFHQDILRSLWHIFKKNNSDGECITSSNLMEIHSVTSWRYHPTFASINEKIITCIEVFWMNSW